MKTGNSRKMAALLSTAFMLGATGVTAFASNVTPPAQVQQAAGEQENESNEKADQAALAAQAQISEADAAAAAAVANPGWSFVKSELDSKNGVIVYELKGTDAGGQKQEVTVNAIDGSIIQETEEND